MNEIDSYDSWGLKTGKCNFKHNYNAIVAVSGALKLILSLDIFRTCEKHLCKDIS